MKRASRWMWIGLAVYVVSWFIQVEKDGITLSDGNLPGWQALRLALEPIWRTSSEPLEGSLIWQILSVLSGLSNLVVPLSLVWIAGANGGESMRRLARMLLLAGLINLQWLRSAPDLRAGYYCWAVAFWVLGFAALQRAKAMAKPAP